MNQVLPLITYPDGGVNKMTKQRPKLAPGVKLEMLSADYWLSAKEEEVLLNASEIAEFNQQSLQRAREKHLEAYLRDLADYPDEISGSYLLEAIDPYSISEKAGEKGYFSDGKRVTDREINDLIKNCNLQQIPDRVRVKFGMLLRRSNLRALPADKIFASSPDTTDQDLLQLTALSAGTPVLIFHHSLDWKWCYVQAPTCRGWVKGKQIGIARNRAEIFSYINSERFLIVTGSRVETEPNPFDTSISNVLSQMGDKIPLVADRELPDSIPEDNQQAQSPEGCYVIWLPVRAEGGCLSFRKALIARGNDLREGYLPYTRKNIISQAFKLLGERYGWGGLFTRRDCSRFIMDIFRTAGIQLPRDSGAPQEEIPPGKTVHFSGSIKDRRKALLKLAPGDVIYMKGHVMMYLGQAENKHYVIHAGSGYSKRNEKNEIEPVTVHGVFVMELEQFLKNGEKTYLETLKLARSFV